VVPAGGSARQAPNGQQLCELCPVRLSRAKGKLHKYGVGHICTTCYNVQKGLVASRSKTAALAPPPPATKKRRVQSDPGEQRGDTPPQSMTRRVCPPLPAAALPQPRMTRQEERIMRMLDETHARRMASLPPRALRALVPESPSGLDSAVSDA
jgi:hypothetical protein